MNRRRVMRTIGLIAAPWSLKDRIGRSADDPSKGSRIELERIDRIGVSALSRDGKVAAVGEGDRPFLKVWSARQGQDWLSIPEVKWPITAVATNPDGTRIAACSYSQFFQGRVQGEDPDGGDDAERVIIGNRGSLIRVWDTSGRLVGSLGSDHDRHPAVAIAFGPDRDQVVTIDPYAVLTIWDVRTGQRSSVIDELKRKDRVDGQLQLHAFDAATRHAATLMRDGSDILMVWSIADGKARVLPGRWGGTSLALDRGGRRIALATLNEFLGPDFRRTSPETWRYRIKILHFDTGRVIGERECPAQGPRQAPTCVAFNADGTLLASGGQDGVVRIWNTEIDAPPGVIEGPGLHVREMAFVRDGLRVVCGGTSARKAGSTQRRA